MPHYGKIRYNCIAARGILESYTVAAKARVDKMDEVDIVDAGGRETPWKIW